MCLKLRAGLAIARIAAFSAASVLWAQHPQQMQIKVERSEPSGWKVMNPAHVFEQGDRLRFHITSSFSGYLYVMDQGTTGNYELLFPRTDTGNDNRIEAGKDYAIPARDGNFRVTGPAGHDVIYWLISPVDFGKQYRPVPPTKTGESTTSDALTSSLQPRCDDTIFKARGDCIDTAAGVRAVGSGDQIPDHLSGTVKPTPRELLFIQDNNVGKESVVVSSPAPLTGPVIYELRLAHR